MQTSDTGALIDRIGAALRRIEGASEKAGSVNDTAGPSSAKVTTLVNRHEAMREEVAGTLRELDSIISKLEI